MAVEERQALRREEDQVMWTAFRRQTIIFRSIALGYLCLLVGLVVGLYVLERRDTRRLRNVAFAECKRVQVLRDQSNLNARVVWSALYRGGQREAMLAIRSAGAQAQVHKTASKNYFALAAALRYTPPTNCFGATDTVEKYVPPTPKPFAKSDLIR